MDVLKALGKTILAVAGLLLILGMTYLLVALMSYGVFWSFDLVWSWKIAFGIWICFMLLWSIVYSFASH